MTYTATSDGQPELRIAIHDDADGMDVWDVPSVNRHLIGSGMIVPEFMHSGQYVLFYGHEDIRVAFSKNLVAWHSGGHALAAPRHNDFDNHPLKVISATNLEQGIMVLYSSIALRRGQTTVSIGVMLCAARDPEHVVWRSDEPLYEYVTKAKDEPRVLGAVVYEDEIVVYLSSARDKIIEIEFANPYRSPVKPRRAHRLHRFPENPIMSPTQYEWESRAVFNPAAFMDNGRVHLLYRAMGPDGISRLGYASSADGIHFDERLDHPVYNPLKGFGEPSPDRDPDVRHYDPVVHPSGGGWAGCEDPRAVTLDGRAYLSFVAFDGWDFVRQAMTSISLDDLNNKIWKWKPPVLLSKPGELQKNWVIFPEKIHGKYAILHGLSPNIHIEYVSSLSSFNGKKFINSLPQAGGAGYEGRADHWDSRVRGTGAPPLKTPMGWLLLYHATDKRDPGKYKLGAMLLDLDDPTKILFRSSAPILEPEEWYENQGKPGVVYTCGAVIAGENLIVYYGGGDKHIAIARANVKEFLTSLVEGHSQSLTHVRH